MNKKLIEYLIIATAIIILLYGCYTMSTYGFHSKSDHITDSITMYYPSSSGYTIDGDKIEFRNSLYDFYDMDVSKLNSSDKRLTSLLGNFANFGTVNYLNDSCYMITIELEDDSGFKYHSMIVPIDSFNKDNSSFSKDTSVYLFDGNDKKFVERTAFKSQVVF